MQWKVMGLLWKRKMAGDNGESFGRWSTGRILIGVIFRVFYGIDFDWLKMFGWPAIGSIFERIFTSSLARGGWCHCR
jgi:hypothetical protein